MKYRDEDDKCYGIAGMAIGLAIFDAENLFTGVTLEADGIDCISFAPEYYFNGNPSLSAKESWHNIYQNYHITMGLVIADTLCRKMVRDRGVVDKKMRKQLFDAACEEGMESCQLENDEVEKIFEKSYSYLIKAFGDKRVRNVITDLAKELKSKRTMSRNDVLDKLRILM